MNGQLFTQDFLARGIASSPVWTAPIVREHDENAHGRLLTKDLVLAYINAIEAGDLKTTVSV